MDCLSAVTEAAAPGTTQGSVTRKVWSVQPGWRAPGPAVPQCGDTAQQWSNGTATQMQHVFGTDNMHKKQLHCRAAQSLQESPLTARVKLPLGSVGGLRGGNVLAMVVRCKRQPCLSRLGPNLELRTSDLCPLFSQNRRCSECDGSQLCLIVSQSPAMASWKVLSTAMQELRWVTAAAELGWQ
jgi:hypothetical protein